MSKWIYMLVAMSTVCAASTTHAAVITWESGTDVATDTDVRTDGFLVEAFNLGGSTRATAQTVKRVVFADEGGAFLSGNNNSVDWLDGETTGIAAYDGLIGNTDYGNGADIFTKVLGGGNLVIGDKYLIQLWYVDRRSSQTMRFGDGNGNTVDLTSDPGQYVVGSFTADGTSQDLTLDAVTPGNAHFSAYQVRDVSEGYQSDFTGADLASAGLVATTGVSGNWVFDAVNNWIDGQRTSGNPRGNVYTSCSWQNDLGFTLEVTFNRQQAGARYSFGIVDAAYTVSSSGDGLGTGLAGAYGIGFTTDGSLEGVAGGDALGFNDGTGSGGDYGGSYVLSVGQGDITLNTLQRLFITVTADSWSYSLNGAVPTKGSFATPFDTSRSYRFTAHAQDVDEQYITSIKLRPRTKSYQSDFTGADLASAGLATSTGTSGYWILDTANDRAEGTGGGNARANLYTLGSWQNDVRLTLDVTFEASGDLTRYSFGLVDATYPISSDGDWLNSSLGAYGIGFSAAGSGPSDYLGFNNGSSVSVLSVGQGLIGAGSQTMRITVTPDSWSYSLNGAVATKGSFATPFDTSRRYRFTAHAQRLPSKYFTNITLFPGTTGMVFVIK